MPLVLVVDDDIGVCAALERSLQRLGYDVVIAPNGTEGLEQALRARPAVVLADVHMPGMDGHALLRSLMRSELQASVVLMSAEGELDDVISALREGAVDYLKKPWTHDELVAVLERAMGLYNALRELRLSPESARAAARLPGTGGVVSVDASALIEELAGHENAEELALPAIRPAVTPLSETGDDATVLGLVREAFPIGIAPLRTLNDRIWRFSVSRALAMRGIALMAQVEKPIDWQQYHRVGLLLDVGASYLLSAVSGAMERLGGGLSDSVKLTAAIATHHAHVGSLILQRWEFPPEVTALARDHHLNPTTSPAPLWCAAALGAALAVRVAGFGDPTGDQQLRPELLARCAYTLGVGDTVLRRLTKSLTEEANQIWTAFDE